MNYRDALADDATREQCDECITAAARSYARWRLDDAGDADGEQAAA